MCFSAHTEVVNAVKDTGRLMLNTRVRLRGQSHQSHLQHPGTRTGLQGSGQAAALGFIYISIYILFTFLCTGSSRYWDPGFHFRGNADGSSASICDPAAAWDRAVCPAGMLLLSQKQQGAGAKELSCHRAGRWDTGADTETAPTNAHPCISLFFFYSRKLCSSKKPGCPKLCTPRGCRAVQRRAGKSHKAAVEPSHRTSLLKQREELQKANSVSSEKKLILCSCLNKLYSFPSGTFIPVYSTTSEMV